VVLRPYGGDGGLYIGFGWPGLKRIGVKISEVLTEYTVTENDSPMLVWCDETKDQLLNSEETQRVRNHRKNVINRTIIIIANIAWILPQTNVCI